MCSQAEEQILQDIVCQIRQAHSVSNRDNSRCKKVIFLIEAIVQTVHFDSCFFPGATIQTTTIYLNLLLLSHFGHWTLAIALALIVDKKKYVNASKHWCGV